MGPFCVAYFNRTKRRQCLVDLSAHASGVQEGEDVSPGLAHRAEVAQGKYNGMFHSSSCHL